MDQIKNDKKVVLEDDGYCFACGKNNPVGLRLVWETKGNITTTYFTPEKKFQGYTDILHGGILATVLDEAMGRLVWKVLGPAVTGEINIRYLAPVKIGEKLFIKGEIIQKKKRVVYTEAAAEKADGTVVAKASGKNILRN